MKKYPIGIQSFEKIRSSNFYYVDKTEFVYNLVKEESGYYFLSRPRRFGKSLFIDTLHQAFAECVTLPLLHYSSLLIVKRNPIYYGRPLSATEY